MRLILLFAFLIILIFLVSCNQREQKEAAESYPVMMEETGGRSHDLKADEDINIDRKIIKEGSIQFETSDLHGTKAVIDKAVEGLNGYIAQESINDYNDKIQYHLQVRVSADNFDNLIERISATVENLESKNINVRDVTEEYIDLKARMETKKELEQRYRELLKQADTVEEILAIEKEIAKIREEIESVEGRLEYLKGRISFSTLSVTFYEKTASDFGFLSKFIRGLENGWNNLLWFLIGLVNIWPFLLLIAAGIIFSAWFYRKKKNR